MRYREKRNPDKFFEVITFDEVGSFEHAGCTVTQESKERYLIETPLGTMRMGRGEVLLLADDGRLSLYETPMFLRNHELV